MTAQEAIAYIEHHTWSKTRLGLGRTRELLDRLGNPQKKLKFVHVAGSNGKGSACAMLASVLKAAGYRTGLYTSPAVQCFHERIQIDGKPVSDDDLAEITGIVKEQAERMEDHPSQFELVTAIAMLYYLKEQCDIIVLEVGMGGELDSTNVIDAPEAAVIMNLALEHTEYLGNTIEEIAATKAGIIKSGCEAVCYPSEQKALDTIAGICSERGVPVHIADPESIIPGKADLSGQSFTWNGLDLKIPLLGAHQLKNLSVVLETVQVLRKRGWQIPDEALRAGLAAVKWPARFEVLREEPVFILDGGHNSQCAEALVYAIRTYLPGRKVVFLVGILKDKDYDKIIDLLQPYAKRFLCLTPDSDRALMADELASIIQEKGYEAEACPDISEAVRRMMEGDEDCIAFGSLYMAGDIRTEVLKHLNAAPGTVQIR